MLYENKVGIISCAVMLAGALALNVVPAWALQETPEHLPSGVVGEIPGAPVAYCHMKFPAIDEKTLGSERPTLQDGSSQDIIDYYGPCNHDPLGPDEVQKQIQEQQMESSREGSSD